MQPPYNDGRKSRKRHLIRNFSMNPESQPSQIPEEERASSGSLPELIVEPAPNRHDDPPEYYEGLERRMKRYYRQLFLGAHGSDDDISSDFEVNRSMASTIKLDVDTRNDKGKGDTKRETHLRTSINSDADYDESGTYDDKLIDICDTYTETSHISIDDTNRFSSTGALSESYETDVDSNVNDNNKDNTNQSQATDEDRLHLQLNDDARHFTVDEIEEIVDNKSVSEDSCERVSSTIAQIHEPRPERPQMVDDGTRSHVLIPRFGRNSVGRHFGQSINVLLTSGNKSVSEESTQDYKRVSTTIAQIHEPRPERPQMVDDGTRSPVLIPRLGRNRVGRHSGRSFNVLLTSGNKSVSEESTQDYKRVSTTIAQIHEPRPERPQMVDDGTRSPVLIPRFGRNRVGRHSGRSFNVLLTSGNKSVSEESTQDYKRVSTTIAQIHEPRPERPQMVDDGTRSPVLIPRFGRNSVGRLPGQSFNVLLASDEIAKTFSPQKSNKKSEIDKSHAEMMREAMETRGNVSGHGATSQATPTLAFEAPTSAKELQEDTEPLSNLKKRKAAPIDENPPVKKKK